MSIVRVIEPCVVEVNGLPFALQIDTPYDSDDEIVRLYPWVFGRDNEVEAATAAPGEKRTTRR